MLCPSTVRTYRKVYAIYALTFLILLPILCNELPYSKYYTHDRSKRREEDARRVEAENQERVAAAKFYLKQNGPYSRTFRQLRHRLERKSKPELVITVVTVARKSGGESRPGPQYLTQVVAKFAELLTQQENVVFQVCNVNTPPEGHREAVYLSRYVPVISRNSSSAEPVPTSAHIHKFEKEKQDYVFCMERSLELQPDHILMIQDDAVPRTDFFPVFQHLLKYNVEGKIVSGDLQPNPEKWAFWKLYYPERWQGYGNEEKLLLELICSGLIGGGLFVALNCGGFTERDSRRRTMVFVLGFFYAVLLCLAIGRQYLIELRRLSVHTYAVVDAPDCCIPAVLYSPEQAAAIVQYLKGQTCSSLLPIDLALDNYVHSSGLKQYLVEPNLFHHIGIVSTLHAGIKNPVDF
ncbi:post-GPI attachment to proteins factor 4-like [Branchiostoma lanceolatum]|uniref:post-GPI attachment to proteins factor 4-like n=1 Tax=Branchiostoma lanceolatum TaxID=7740 RepID=UPI0034526832